MISLGYFLLFRRFYREPADDPHLSDAERGLITQNRPFPLPAAEPGHGTYMLRTCLTSRKVLGLSLGFAAYGYAFSLYLFWLPSYLTRQMHVSLFWAAAFSVIPWSCATVSDLAVGGWLVDRLVSRDHDQTRVRQTIIVFGMVAGFAILGAALSEQLGWAIFWISLSLSGLALVGAVAWSLPGLLAPGDGAGTVGGIMNFSYSVATILAPIVTGLLVNGSGSFSRAFAVAAAILGIGALSFIFMLGRITPIETRGQ